MNKYTKKADSNVGASHNAQINPFLVSSEDQTSTKYKIRIWGEIESTEDFMYAIDVLESAKEQDVVELHINSNGGDVDATMTLIHAMQKCVASTHVIMTGTCASCGTMPMFYSDSWESGEFTSFMFHDLGLGLPVQTMSATKALTEHNYNASEKIIRQVYKGFFTEEEFLDILKGKQHWMTPEEVGARFKRRTEAIEQEGEQREAHSCSSCNCQ